MTAISFALNGQTLVLFSSSATLYDTNAHAVAGTNAVTLPATLSTDVTYYTAPAAYKTSIVMKQPDGTAFPTYVVGSGAWQDNATIEPEPTRLQLAADVGALNYFQTQQLTVGQESVPRLLAASSATMTSGTLRLSYFTARKTDLVGSLRVNTGTTAAGATPTLIRLGIYTIAANGDITLAASTVNDTALLAVGSTAYTKALSSAYQVNAGQRYAVGLLVVTGATAPTVHAASANLGIETWTAPRMSAGITGQTDLPSSVVDASQSVSAANPFIVLVP